MHDAPLFSLDGEIIYGKDHIAPGLGDLNAGEFQKRLEQYEYIGSIVFGLSTDDAYNL